jgi:hypothetical protein
MSTPSSPECRCERPPEVEVQLAGREPHHAIAALARPCRATILDLGDGRVIVLMADGCPVCTAARERQRQWEAAHAAETPKATTLKPPTLTDEWA